MFEFIFIVFFVLPVAAAWWLSVTGVRNEDTG